MFLVQWIYMTIKQQLSDCNDDRRQDIIIKKKNYVPLES